MRFSLLIRNRLTYWIPFEGVEIDQLHYRPSIFHPHNSAGVGIRDLAGDAFDFLRKSSSLIQEHYPERSAVIMIVNAPSWFSFLWKSAWTYTKHTCVCVDGW